MSNQTDVSSESHSENYNEHSSVSSINYEIKLITKIRIIAAILAMRSVTISKIFQTVWVSYKTLCMIFFLISISILKYRSSIIWTRINYLSSLQSLAHASHNGAPRVTTLLLHVLFQPGHLNWDVISLGVDRSDIAFCCLACAAFAIALFTFTNLCFWAN